MTSPIRPSHEGLRDVTRAVVGTYTECSKINHLGHDPLPSRESVMEILRDLTEVIFPGFGLRQNLRLDNIEYYVGSLIDAVFESLREQILRALRHDRGEETPEAELDLLARNRTLDFLRKIPDIRRVLNLDVTAAFKGDPAARTHHEIIFCYPGLEAITIYRIAHELLKLGVPYIPRMMTEYAHFRTGIDIHPGATIGHSFFIDHGTGVVIGETCEIGNGVKLYQGVTLGALSFEKNADGELVRGTKRHPTLKNDVTVYANATILGGKTIIGERSVVGSNVWLTYSVDPDTVVVLEKPQLKVKGTGPKSEPAYMWHI